MIRSFRKKSEIAASERELRAMTHALEEVHADVSRPALEESIDEWRDDLAGTPATNSRRAFLRGAGGAIAGGAVLATLAGHPGLAIAATTGAASSSPSSNNDVTNSRGGIGGLSGDLAVAALAASLENLAVYAYSQGIAAAQGGKLGSVPPAVVTFATTVRSQHEEHAQAWNAILRAAHKHPVTVLEPSLAPVVMSDLMKVGSVTDLATLALNLENRAAQTYQVQATRLRANKAIQTAATIQPVEMQHAAILYYALGKYPGVQDASGNPLAFNPTSSAVS